MANAFGTGVADDKAIYHYVPEMIRFYLGEEPILKNVPTWRCREQDSLSYVLDHLPEHGFLHVAVDIERLLDDLIALGGDARDDRHPRPAGRGPDRSAAGAGGRGATSRSAAGTWRPGRPGAPCRPRP